MTDFPDTKVVIFEWLPEKPKYWLVLVMNSRMGLETDSHELKVEKSIKRSIIKNNQYHEATDRPQ